MGNRYIQGLFLKYLDVVQTNPFVSVLYQFSPLFTDIVNMFLERAQQQFESSLMITVPEKVMILD